MPPGQLARNRSRLHHSPVFSWKKGHEAVITHSEFEPKRRGHRFAIVVVHTIFTFYGRKGLFGQDFSFPGERLEPSYDGLKNSYLVANSKRERARIDFILPSKRTKVLESGLLRPKLKRGKDLSDHFPVFKKIELLEHGVIPK